jgi:hypothetical protein
MPYKIEIRQDEIWRQVDDALTEQIALQKASAIYKRVRFLDQDDIRIVKDGEVIC